MFGKVLTYDVYHLALYLGAVMAWGRWACGCYCVGRASRLCTRAVRCSVWH